jgi:hypothetical protein
MTPGKGNIMLRVKLDRETVVKAVEYHARDNKGVEPVIGDDDELCEWLEYALRDVGGLGDGTAESDLSLSVEAIDGGAWFVVGGNEEVIDAIRHYIL